MISRSETSQLLQGQLTDARREIISLQEVEEQLGKDYHQSQSRLHKLTEGLRITEDLLQKSNSLNSDLESTLSSDRHDAQLHFAELTSKFEQVSHYSRAMELRFS